MKGNEGEAVSPVAASWRAKVRERLCCVSRRMRGNARAGSAVVEFAFIAPVFFVLLMGIIEAGIIFFAQSVLQNATNDAARLIRTGQVAAASMTQTQFRTTICNEIGPLLACDSNLLVDVESFSSFSSVTYTSALTSGNALNTNLNNYSIGAACSIVLVRTFYTWNVVTPLLTTFLVNMTNNQHLLTAAAAFRNEPYTTTVSGC